MNTIRWVGRHIFYHESLKDRQIRKLGKIDYDLAKKHNNDDTIIPPHIHDELNIEGIPILGLPPSYKEAVLKTYTNNKKKKRNGKKKLDTEGRKVH